MNSKLKKIFLHIILLLSINLFTNYNYFLQFTYQDKSIVYSENNFITENNTYEITNINKKAKIIKLCFDGDTNDVNISFTSDSFSNYNHPNTNYNYGGIKNNYLYVYTTISDNITGLKIFINSGKLKEVIINPYIPYNLNILKTLIIYLTIISLIYVFKNKDSLNLKDKKQKLGIIIILVLFTSLLTNFWYNNNYKGNYSFYSTEYTDSLIKGKLSLDIPVSDEIKNASNPYDPSDRKNGFQLDLSYYNGKYYSYFGLLPNIELFVPYKIITKSYLKDSIGCLIYSILSILSIFLIFKNIAEKYFSKITFRTFILSFLFIAFGCKILWCMHRPNFYELVTIAALFHVILGLNLVLFNKKDNTARYILGYTLLAISVLSRPTSLLASLLVLPKFFKNIKQKKLKDYMILILPYAIIGIIAAYINYIRFDNIFEFGIKYQLSDNNMYSNKFSIIKGIFGGFYYLFGTYDMQILPFKITDSGNYFSILGDFHFESIGGGIITTSFIPIIVLFIPFIINKIKEKELRIYLALASIIALVLVFITSGIGALVGRYMIDFNYLFLFVGVFISLYFIEKDKSKILNIIYLNIIIISIFINFFISFSNL